jgi:hypothetical protein
MTRDQALAIAAERKAARRHRTGRIRKTVAALAVAAFLGPFAVIYTQLAAGHDPALANSNPVAATADASTSTDPRYATASGSTSGTSASTSSDSTSTGSTSSGSTSSDDDTSSSTASPAAMTTQQS